MGGNSISWDFVPLDDLTEEETPITYGVVKPGEEGEVRFVRGGDIAGGRVLMSQLRTISGGVSEQYRRTLLRGGEILVSLVGNPGQVAIAPAELAGANIARQVGLVRLKPGIDTRFVSYFLQSHEGQTAFGAQSLGSVQQVINLRDLKTVKVPLPPFPEQRAIGSVLGSLDDKIELNRRMNETLEALAQSLFKSWFVDPTQSALPKGWREGTLGDVIEVKHGFAYQGQFFRDESCRDILLTPGNFAIGGGFKEDKFKYYEGPTPDEYVLSEGDLLITMTDLSKAGDTLGYGSLLPSAPDGHRFHHNQRLGKVLIKDASFINKPFLYQILRSHEYRAEILGGATGTTVKHTSPGRIKSFKFILPPEPLMHKFGNVAGAWHELASHNRKESRTLAALRDALLPKLLSGELRVPVGKRS